MSTSIDEIKKFLSEKGDANNTETLRVDRIGGTNSTVESYRITFLDPQEDKPKKEAPKSEPVKKSSKK